MTYWNNLGWVDPFSQPLLTERQERYVSNLGAPEVYTPQMVVNGHRQFVGSNSDELQRTLRVKSKRETFPLAIEIVQRTGSELIFQVDTAGRSLPRDTELWVALTDDLDVSKVSHGENTGRSLRHVAVVRSLTRASESTTDLQKLHVALPASIIAAPEKPHHLVVMAQQTAQGEITGAAIQAF